MAIPAAGTGDGRTVALGTGGDPVNAGPPALAHCLVAQAASSISIIYRYIILYIYIYYFISYLSPLNASIP